MKKFLLFIPLIICFFSCKKEEIKDFNPTTLIDFHSTSDLDFSVFENPKFKDFYNKTYDKNTFFNHYFKVWNTEKVNLTDNEFNEYFNYDSMVKKSPCYGDNYLIHSDKTINYIKNILPTDKNLFTNKYGIVTNSTNLRILPTNELCLKNIQNAGEGYPFDYFQNSGLAIATPVKILSKTKDNIWFFVDSNNNKGWVKSSDIAMVSKKQINKIQKMDFVISTVDNQVLNNENTAINFNIGTLLPTKKDKILIPKRDTNNNLIWSKISFKNEYIKPFPIEFNKENIQKTINSLLNGKYTWGDINNGRDCSSTLKDFYTTFGIWIPRNSSQQVKFGKQYNLSENHNKKQKTIINKGIPFLSTVYKKGHIMMYVGTKNNTPLIFHNVWGIKAYVKDRNLSNISKLRNLYGLRNIHKVNENKEVQTRYEIGRTVITTIEPAEKINKLNNFKTEIYLDNIKTLTIFTK